MIIQAKTISPVTSASPAEAVRGELMNSLARGTAIQSAIGKEAQTDETNGDQIHVSKEKLEELVAEIRDTFISMGVSLSFKLNEDNEILQVEVWDAEKEKLIRTIPADELVSLSEILDATSGFLMDKPV